VLRRNKNKGLAFPMKITRIPLPAQLRPWLSLWPPPPLPLMMPRPMVACMPAPAEIVVSGVLPRNQQDILSGVAVLKGAHLDQALRSSIGETLAHTPGVTATSFGPTASRPVLRGMQGERVRVLVNGIGSIDVSNTSADHAPAVNPCWPTGSRCCAGRRLCFTVRRRWAA
jgi:outer membrane receptor protein involved in Fe transport